MEESRLDAVISAQVLAEVAGVLYRQFRVRDITRYVGGMLSYRLKVLPVTAEIVRVAAEYSKEFRILPYDGIHIATAISSGADQILSADRELDRVKMIKRLDPLDFVRARNI